MKNIWTRIAATLAVILTVGCADLAETTLEPTAETPETAAGGAGPHVWGPSEESVKVLVSIDLDSLNEHSRTWFSALSTTVTVVSLGSDSTATKTSVFQRGRVLRDSLKIDWAEPSYLSIVIPDNCRRVGSTANEVQSAPDTNMCVYRELQNHLPNSSQQVKISEFALYGSRLLRRFDMNPHTHYVAFACQNISVPSEAEKLIRYEDGRTEWHLPKQDDVQTSGYTLLDLTLNPGSCP